MDPNALLMAMALMQQQKSRRQSYEDWEREYIRMEELNNLNRVADFVRRAWGWFRSLMERPKATRPRSAPRRTRRVTLPDYGSP